MARDIDMTLLPLADESPPPYTIVRVPVLAEFDQGAALTRVAQYVAAQLHGGMREAEIFRRLHGWTPTEGG